MSQERIQKKPQARDSKGRYTKQDEPQVPENAQELKDALDDLLDEIDAVLEENAEEFVRGYVQKGGQ